VSLPANETKASRAEGEPSLVRRLGIRNVINAAGPATRLGGASLSLEVIAAMAEAREVTTPVAELQAAASKCISERTGAEAGLVTSGAFAALTLACAAAIAKLDVAAMDLLPQSSLPNEFVISRDQRNGYDHAIRLAGGQYLEVGMNERVAGAGVRQTEVREYASALGPRTAGIVYVATPSSQPSLARLAALANERGVPLIVDAANQLPPVGNLRHFIGLGADLVVYSGGKGIRGPQNTGILCGRRELIMSAALQCLDMDEHFDIWTPPADFIDKSLIDGLPRHGLGRGFKVSKQDIIGLLTALELFSTGGYEAHYAECAAVVQSLYEALAHVDGVQAAIDSPAGGGYSTLRITINREFGGRNAFEVAGLLKLCSPPIFVGERYLWDGALVVHPMDLNSEAAMVVANAIADVLRRKSV
jgi:D-glucosaminate-6-phosphate ammonia-lyase